MGEEVVLGAPPPAHCFSADLESASADPWIARKIPEVGTYGSRRPPSCVHDAVAPSASRQASASSSWRRRSTAPPAPPPSPAAAACSPSSSAGSRARRAPAATSPDGADAAARHPASGLEQRLERAGGAQSARRVELPLGRVGRADEVRVVGVREPVRLGAHLRDHAPLLEREDGVDDTGSEEVALDLLPSLRVRARVGVPLADLQREPPRPRRRSAGTTLRPASASAPRGAATAARVSEPPPRNAPRR